MLKSTLPAETLVQPIRRAIGEINPDLLVSSIGGVPQMLESMLAGNNLRCV